MLCPGGGTGIRTSLKRKKEKHLVVSSNLIPGTIDILGVALVLAVSTSDCDSDRVDSNSTGHP